LFSIKEKLELELSSLDKELRSLDMELQELLENENEKIPVYC